MNGARKIEWRAWPDGIYGLAIAGRAEMDGCVFELCANVSNDAAHQRRHGSMPRHVAMRVIRDQIHRDMAS